MTYKLTCNMIKPQIPPAQIKKRNTATNFFSSAKHIKAKIALSNGLNS